MHNRGARVGDLVRYWCLKCHKISMIAWDGKKGNVVRDGIFCLNPECGADGSHLLLWRWLMGRAKRREKKRMPWKIKAGSELDIDFKNFKAMSSGG